MRTYVSRLGVFLSVAVISGSVSFTSLALAEKRFTAQEAVNIALRENRELRSAMFLVDEAKGRLTQSALLPNPEIEFGHTSDRPYNNEGEYSFITGINQRFPISGRLARAKDVARVDVALAETEIENQKRLLSAEVLKLYYGLALTAQKLEFNYDLHTSLQDLVSVAEQRFKKAEIGEVDLNLQKLELEKIILDAAVLEAEKLQKTISLNRLLGRAPEANIVLKESVRAKPHFQQIEKAVREASERRPDRISAALRIDRARNETRLARAERWEDWTLGVEYSKDKSVFSEPIGTTNESFLGVRLSVPLPFWNQNEGKIAEALAAESRARMELEAIDAQVLADTTTSSAKLSALSPVLDRFETQSLELARKNHKTMRQSYASGLVSIGSVLQAQQQLVELQQRYLDARVEFLEELINFQSLTASFEEVIP